MAQLINAGGRDSAALNMSAANGLYEEAVTLDPNNTAAHFGAALTGVLTVFSDPALFSVLNEIPTEGPSPPPFIGNVFSRVSLKQDLKQYGRDLQSQAESRLALMIKQQFPNRFDYIFTQSDTTLPPSFYQNVVEAKLLPALSTAIFHLQRVTQNQQFAFYITPDDAGGELQDSIRIDLTEIYVLLAVFQALHAEASAFVSYNIDYDPEDANAVENAWQVTSPFLALRTNGVQRMRDVRTSWIGMASSIQSGITYYSNETPHPGIDLIPYSPEAVQELSQLYAGMDSLIMVLSGPYQAYNDFNDDNVQEYLTINLKNYFDNAIANYKAKIPAYTVSVEAGNHGEYVAVLTWQATSFSNWIFPDPTFNGLLPGITTDAMLKQTFGITAADWEQSVRVGD
ncbi:MAG: hypothetical protein EPO24_16715 [Bacteroidetes bacterium]|nr:MAG: hypothetical protein EPO24_16715 [Bacteroidota bacterium]